MRLELDSYLKLSDDICKAPNLTARFGADDLKKIGAAVFEGYDRDLQSRRRWHERMRAAMELALQIKPGKTFPWPNAANVAFPLLTIAALQFHSRAYPALFSGPDLVKYKVTGPDTTGETSERALLVARYMSYQVLEQDEAFEEQHDRLYIHIPIVGCGFTKSRYSPREGHNVSEFVPAEDLVVDYYAKSIDQALRKTQHVLLYRNDIWERCAAGTFRDIREEPWYCHTQTPMLPKQSEKDQISGQSAPSDSSGEALFLLEQHTWLDLDGDGYSEPYIITIDRSTKEVLRIVARWEMPEDVERIRGKIFRIRATEYFTKHELIPSPDGGFYGLGFGALVGPLNESVDTLVNQMLDAGTMMNTAGGFMARGVKIRGGAQRFDPFGWNHVDATGDDLRKGIFPIPVREPSAVLFNLLTLLINYTQRISGSTDVMAGENPGQNTPAYNMQSMVEQGMKIYSAIFKRLWRSMKQEFSKLYLLNGRHLPERVPFGGTFVTRDMFLDDPSNLVPMADPNMVSDGLRTQQAVTIKQAALATPGYDTDAVERRFLRTLKVDDIDVIFPGSKKLPPPPNPKAAVEELKTQRKQLELQHAREEFIMDLMEQRRLNNAQIIKLEADAAKAMAEASGADAAVQLQILDARLRAIKDHNDVVNNRLDILMNGAKNESGSSSDTGDGGGVAPPPSDEILQKVPPLASGIPEGAMGPGNDPGTE